jgi:ATP-binding cassette, subfamily B, bacterial
LSPLGRRIVGLFRPYRGRVLGIALLVVVSSVLGVVNPLLTKQVFDKALFVAGGPDLHKLYLYVVLMVIVAIVGGLASLAQTYAANVLGQQVMQDLRSRLFGHLQQMSLRFFTGTRTGEIQSRLTSDVAGVQSVVTTTATSILGNGVSFASALVAMLILSWQLTIVALVMVPVFFWLTRLVGERRRRVTMATQRTVADLTALTEESLSVSGVLLAKVFHRQDADLASFNANNSRMAKLQVRQQMIGQSFFTVIQTFLSITPAFVYLVAGWQLGKSSGITAGTVVAFTTLQTRMYFPIGQLLQTIVELRSSVAYFERIFEYLDLEPDVTEDPDPVVLEPATTRGQVRYRDVGFRYDPSGPLTLDGVDIEIQPGQLAALVGPSGAGKTTMGYLLPRLYDVNSGAVEIDGVDVRRLSFESLAGTVGFVTQESYLFHATIRENLRYGKPDATDAEIEHAARSAAIHDRIMSFPDGYDTTVGERGYRLSGGEKQRVAIARVLLHDPKVLLLDEATSALDSTSERLIQSALALAMTGRTTLAIAHRLSTIVAADVIYVVDGGKVVEHGTHADLLAVSGLYASLYREQFGSGTIEARCSDGVLLADGTVIPDTHTEDPDSLQPEGAGVRS